jgi:hypothetical protein
MAIASNHSGLRSSETSKRPPGRPDRPTTRDCWVIST